MKKALSFLFVALFLIGLDGFIKAYVHHEIPHIASSLMVYPYGGIPIIKGWHGIDFCIVHVINRGAAWGMFSAFQDYLLYVRVAIIGGLISYILFATVSSYRRWCFLLVTVGALGNVLDHFIYGHVVDMFYFKFWGYSFPVFNVADSVIFVGIVLLLAERLFCKKGE